MIRYIRTRHFAKPVRCSRYDATMFRPPPPSEFYRYPATSGTAVLAIAVSLWWWIGNGDIAVLEMSYRAWDRFELWRLVTSALPHVDILHLLFNLYWLWVFGSVLEREWGSWAAAGAFVLLAAGSCAAEHAAFNGGVGLSGVGYGLFGFMWLAGHRQWRFREVMDRTTVQLFVGWFVFCIVMTLADIWPIANVAHGMGAVLGLLLAAATTSKDKRQTVAWIAALVLVTAACGAGSAIGRPYVGLGANSGLDLAFDGATALEHTDNARAKALLERAVRIGPRQAGWWYKLGIARFRTGDVAGGREAFQKAVDLDPGNAQYRDALESTPR
ncbi:MAG: tetratricopeptide repeat protein [Phycisphaera sp.]|nr:tetratricopeptide repeat protein [Phycisphaera sp.]